MKKTFLLKTGMSVIIALFALKAFAQPISGTLIPFTYTAPGGATVANGVVVTIPSGVTVEFDQGLRIDPGGKVVVNGGTILMATGQSIVLVQSSLINGAILELNNGSLITSVTSAPLNGVGLWQGIVCKNAASGIQGGALLQMDGATIRYAQCAYTHYDPNLGFEYGFGRLHAVNSTFYNNVRCLDIGNTYYMPVTDDSITWIGNYAEGCTFQLSADFFPPATPPDMIKMMGAGLILHSCEFYADPYYSSGGTLVLNDYINSTTAIDAHYSIIWMEKQAGSALGCSMGSFQNGLVVDNGFGYNVIFSNSLSHCINDINISGSNSPLIIGSEFYKSFGSVNSSGVFLRNCPRLRVEGNYVENDDNNIAHTMGIIAMNSGDADNEIYRNQVVMLTTGVGIGSIGTNRSADGTTGLTMFCNSLSNPLDYSYSFNIAVGNDIVSNPVNGIRDDQFVTGSGLSAGNKFISNLGNPYTSYYLESGTNNMSAFTYKYNPAVTAEQPVATNITNLMTASANTCPVHRTRNPQPSMAAAPPKEGRPKAVWSGEKGQEKAALPSGILPAQLRAFTNLKGVDSWLKEHNNRWSALPKDMKQQVYDAEAKDPGQGGAMARALLSYYEGRKYPPVALSLKPEKPELTVSAVIGSETAIYPNPAHDKIEVNWKGSQATLQIITITGQPLLKQVIATGITTIDISRLIAGTYLVQIRDDQNHTCNQKLTVR